MRRYLSHNRITCLKLVALGFIVAMLVALHCVVASVHAQSCSGTPPPPDTSHPIFRAGANVFVMYDSSLSQTQIDQARAGFQSWNAAGAVYFQDQNGVADASIYVTNGQLASNRASGESYQAGPDGTIETPTITLILLQRR